MKLIAEYVENNLEVIVEANEKGEKKYAIEGVFAQADQKNRKGRIYPKAIMEKAVGKYVDERRAEVFVFGDRADIAQLFH